ncbi:dolichyl-phosphate-mannose--protein mannosyltransferase [Corynebacterium diphtheriae]|uniref:phospholipid carrier-dependent glycosyltransferase n=1 Tax=Corynebacterium diphtheriae TaxID=1717 RepID=UPI0018CBC86F|nr:phospholipid carrier-dependent glycosyltransferase [Corynebacterium diphtheriae bv. gravis]
MGKLPNTPFHHQPSLRWTPKPRRLNRVTSHSAPDTAKDQPRSRLTAAWTRRRRYAPRFPSAAHPHAPHALQWSRYDTISTAIITIAAFLMRAIGITSATSAHTPVFDEKHYVPQAWDMVESWINPITGGIESNPGYGLVVHPPLAKQLIAYGEALFGYTPLGWRAVTALCGTLTIVAIMALTRRLTLSSRAATLAGIIALFDGVLLVTSRFGMLDIIQVLFIVTAAWTLCRDHQQVYACMYNAWSQKLLDTDLGPRIGFRWWRFATGVLLGCAVSVKWSGLYYIMFFGILAVALDAWRRRIFGARNATLGMLLKDAFPAFASLVLVPLAVYTWSWRAWFASETSVFRHAVATGDVEGNSILRLFPDAVASWLYYHAEVLEFHASLTSSSGHSHPWDSKPWSWLAATRPILYYSSTDISCAFGSCRRMIYLFGTPAIWWLTVPVVCWALWEMIIRRRAEYLIPWVSFMAGFLPWLASYDRQMYFFYATALVPFTIVMLAITLNRFMDAGAYRRLRPAAFWKGRVFPTGRILAICYLAVVIAMFFYFSPLLYGFVIPDAWFNAMMWLPSWR